MYDRRCKIKDDRIKLNPLAIALKQKIKMYKNNTSSEQHDKQVSTLKALPIETGRKNSSKVASTVADRTKRAKIIHDFDRPHPLLRFVTAETVAFLFSISVEQIYRIECWEHIVYVHAEGVSRFVSYADFPPVISTEKANRKDFIYWRKRWAKKFKQKEAPEFWVKFYTQKFVEAKSIYKLRKWGKLIATFKFIFESANIQRLRENYSYQMFLIKIQQK